MEQRLLGRTGVSVSKLCLGAMMFGAWGNPDHDDSIRIIHAALDAGINFVDTADVYAHGESEEIVGKALEGPPRRRRPRHQVPRRDGRRPQPAGQLAPLDHPRRRGLAAPARHRLDRPLPGPPPAHRHRHRGDAVGASPTSSTRARSATSAHSTFPASQIVEAQWVARERRLQRFVTEQPAYSILVRAHRGRRPAHLPAPRHGRAVLQPAHRRLALRTLAQGRRPAVLLAREPPARALRPLPARQPAQARRRRAARSARRRRRASR